MIEPLNPDEDNLIDFNFTELVGGGWFEEVWPELEQLDENDDVTLKWRNMEIRAKAGSIKAWIELATV